jgi:hypothetical protein
MQSGHANGNRYDAFLPGPLHPELMFCVTETSWYKPAKRNGRIAEDKKDSVKGYLE